MIARVFGRPLVALALCAGVAGSPALAQSQVRVMATVSDGPGGGGGAQQISRRHLDGYADLLGLSAEQREAASALHEGYQAEFEEARGAMQAAMSEARRLFEESQDDTGFRETMPRARNQFRERARALENGFLSDLRLVLTPEQEALWPKVERQRRRETVLPTGTLSGESLNLLEIIAGLRLDGPARVPLAPALEEYETDLDRTLAAKARVLEERADIQPGRGFDGETWQKAMAATREAGLKVREVNQRHARKIEGLLPEEQRAAFNEAVRRGSFPRVYQPSRTAKMIEAAGGLADLDAPQKETLASIRASYERDLAAVNGRWAAAIEATEAEGGAAAGTMVLAGGEQMTVSFGGDEEGPVAEARKARRELDQKTRERLESLLTKEQLERLPAGGEEEREGQFQMGEPMIIRRGG